MRIAYKNIDDAYQKIHKDLDNDPCCIDGGTKNIIIDNRSRAKKYIEMIEEVKLFYSNHNDETDQKRIESCKKQCEEMMEEIEFQSNKILNYFE